MAAICRLYHVSLDEKTSNYSGKQKLIYKNNSPETLHKVFYHLYFNAFQPGSEMAVQLKNSPDKNTRFDVNLDSITKDQQGFLKVENLTQDGALVKTIDSETILEVILNKPLNLASLRFLNFHSRAMFLM